MSVTDAFTSFLLPTSVLHTCTHCPIYPHRVHLALSGRHHGGPATPLVALAAGTAAASLWLRHCAAYGSAAAKVAAVQRRRQREPELHTATRVEESREALPTSMLARKCPRMEVARPPNPEHRP